MPTENLEENSLLNFSCHYLCHLLAARNGVIKEIFLLIAVFQHSIETSPSKVIFKGLFVTLR